MNPTPSKGLGPQRFETFKEHLSSLLSFYTQRHLAKKLCTNPNNFNAYVNGKLPITKAFLAKFYSALQTELDELASIKQQSTDFPEGSKTQLALTEVRAALQSLDGKLNALLARKD